MDPHRSPQHMSPASLSISSPRSLRPREQLHAPTPRYRPTIPQAFYTPSHAPESASDDGRGEHYTEPPMQEEEASEQGSPESRRRFGGGLVNRLRGFPGAFAKHHSRESLYSEYLAEAETVASQDLRRFPSRGEYRRKGDCMFGLTFQCFSHLSSSVRDRRDQCRARARSTCWLR